MSPTRSIAGRPLAGILIAILLCAGTLAPSGALAQSLSIILPPSIMAALLGDLGADCKTPGVVAKCTFKPGETRTYTVDVLSAACRKATFKFDGIATRNVTPDQTVYGDGHCRIGWAKAPLTKGRQVSFQARANADGRALSIWINVRK